MRELAIGLSAVLIAIIAFGLAGLCAVESHEIMAVTAAQSALADTVAITANDAAFITTASK